MKRNKWMAVLLAAVLTLVLCACGGTDENADGSDTPISTEQEAESAEVSSKEDSDSNMVDEVIEAFDMTPTIEETVMLDENDIKITATGLEYDDYEVTLNLTIENNSSQDLSFICGSVGYSCNAINGFMIDGGYLNADVAAGKKSNETINFSRAELSIMGISRIADIQVGFDIKDADYNRVYSGVKQVKTSIADSYDYTVDTYQKAINSGALATLYGFTVDYFAEAELYNQGGIKIVSEAFVKNKDGERMLFLEIVNDSDALLYGVTTSVAVNGLTVYNGTWSSDALNPGSRRVMDISFDTLLDESFQEALGITDISEVVCTLVVKDSEYKDFIAPQEISISIPGQEGTFDIAGTEVYNEGGIRMISKGLLEDPSEYSEDIHMLLVVENNSDADIRVSPAYDSLSLNGFMTDFYIHTAEVPSGEYALLDVQIQGSSLEENGIAGADGITEAEVTLEIKDEKYKSVAEPKVVIAY